MGLCHMSRFESTSKKASAIIYDIYDLMCIICFLIYEINYILKTLEIQLNVINYVILMTGFYFNFKI
jgi:hypothetical protein